MTKLKVSEHDLQTLFMNYLTGNGWYVQRMNAGRIKVDKRLIKLGEAGTPDIMAFKHDWAGQTKMVNLVFIEVKTPQNPHPTDLQKHKMKELEDHGAKCYVIKSFEELEKKFK